MVKAMIDISSEANQILNIVKAKYNLRGKSEAITKIAIDYGEEMIEPELRPEFIDELKKIKKQKGIVFSSVDELRKHIEE